MKGRCYYCNKELTERTIKRHMKSCPEMKKVIEEKKVGTKGVRDQFLISIKDKYDTNVYCIYVSIDASLQLQHLDQFIRDIWVECCNHLSAFYIDGESYDDNRNEQYQMNVKLKDVLAVDSKFEYQYDFGSTTHLVLEVVDMVKVPKKFSQIEIIARNDKVGKSNSPRDGVCGYDGDKNAEVQYLPQNSNEYKNSRKKPRFDDHDLDDIDEFNDEMIEEEVSHLFNDFIEMFFKGKYSFELEELLKSYTKNQLKDISENNDLNIAVHQNKSIFIEGISSQYEDMMTNKIRLLDENIYKILLQYVKNKGIVLLSNVENNLNINLSLMYQGIIFPSVKDEEPIFIMPEVMQDIVWQSDNIEVRNLLKRNSRIINICRGMIKAYGILRFSDINELIKRYLDGVDKYELLSILNQGSIYYSDEYSAYHNEEGDLLFRNENIDEYEEIIDKIDKTSEYAIISEKELVSMIEEDYIEKSNFGKTFMREFTSYFELSKDEIIAYMNDLAMLVQFSDSEEILKEVLSGIQENIGQEGEALICNMLNKLLRNVRLWKYKGATINEKEGNKTIVNKETKVGRNEFCPCGSGKKYKNCCAKHGNVIQLF